MKTILFALMASMAVAFSPAPVSSGRVQSGTALNGVPEAAAQVVGWVAAYGVLGWKFESGAAAAASAPPAATSAVSAVASSAVDLSIPYDAPAKLAYEKAGSPGDFAAFKSKYEADAVADVIAKKK